MVKSGDHYKLTLSSQVLTLAVAISFGDEAVELSDNYVDVLPGEPAIITIKSKALLEQLRALLKTMSLNQ